MHRESASTGALVLLGLASVSLTLGAAGTGSPADCEAARGPPGEEEEDDAGTDARTGTDDDTEPPGPAGGADVDRDVSDDEDDPANDEPTSCSICNINRQGPCRKYWLKFERCMKEHGREREERERREAEAAGEEAEAKESEDPPGADGGDAEDAEAEGAEPSLESQWDEFMVRSTRPGERICGREWFGPPVSAEFVFVHLLTFFVPKARTTTTTTTMKMTRMKRTRMTKTTSPKAKAIRRNDPRTPPAGRTTEERTRRSPSGATASCSRG